MAFPSRLQADLKAKSKKVAKELADHRMAQKMSGHRQSRESMNTGTRDRRSIHGTSQDRVVRKGTQNKDRPPRRNTLLLEINHLTTKGQV